MIGKWLDVLDAPQQFVHGNQIESIRRKPVTDKPSNSMKKTLFIALGLALTGLVAHTADGEAKPAAPPSREEIIKKYDKNGDGKLDQDERAALMKDRQAESLKKYDKNGDGKLDESELQARREDARKQREAAQARRQAEQKQKEEKK